MVSGCYLPMTFSETQADESKSPFENVEFYVASGAIRIEIKDTQMNLTDLKFVSASTVDEDGKELKLKLETKLKTSPHTAEFQVEVLTENTYFNLPFRLVVVTQIGSQTFLITGRFSQHSHTRIVNWVEAVDPGG